MTGKPLALVLAAALCGEARAAERRQEVRSGAHVARAVPVDAASPSAPTPERVLGTLRRSHPRIMADATTFEALRAAAAQGGLQASLYAEVKRQADKALGEPASVYEKRDGRRLLTVSRRVADRVSRLALAARVEGDPRYVARAWQELEAAARFPDWNPAHFLDTAEMTHAFALGYDWLYDRWTEEQRRTLSAAILEKGLKPGLKVYASGKGWPRNENNWNQVCNGGLISGALAIADVEPAVAAQIVCAAVQSLPLAMRHYEPDGAGTEGVTYWGYGSHFNIVMLASLQTALGTDFGLSRVGAFDKSGFYPLYLCGAGRYSFDFADCSVVRISEPQHFWLARQYGEPLYSRFRLEALESGAEPGTLWDLLWYDARGKGADLAALPLDRHFRHAECASMRSAWSPDALIVGIQAGDSMNLGGHRHLDLGSFIVDAQGERWIIDSGKEHETYMTHTNRQPRHAFYRVRAEGHNVPVLNPGAGPDQDPKAVAAFTRFESFATGAVAVVDLTQAYRPHATRVLRTFEFQERKRLVVTDEIDVAQPAELWWFLHTAAKVALSDGGRTATLTQKGKAFTVRLAEPQGAAFAVRACEPLPTSPNPKKQADNSKRRKLALNLHGVQAARIRVVLEPQ